MATSRKRKNRKKTIQYAPVQAKVKVGERPSARKDENGVPIMEPVYALVKTNQTRRIRHNA